MGGDVPIRIGLVVLPQLHWPEAARRWRAVEAMRFDHAWTYDHLAWRDLADQPWFATVPTLTAVAAVTSRIRLGTWVASPNFRHPVTFAKDVMTLDDISAGRVVLAVGAGGPGWDDSVMGAPVPTPGQRVDRLDAFLSMLDGLLTGTDVTRTDGPYEAVRARMYPGPVQQPRPPFVVAANGPRTIALAVRHARPGDGWATLGTREGDQDLESWWRGVGELVSRVDDELAAAGRSAGSLDRYLSLDAAPVFALSSLEAFRDAVGRARELRFTDVVAHWPRPEPPYQGDEQVLEAVAAELDTLRGGPSAAGAPA